MKLKVHHSEIELTQGDITESDTEAIVNAANSDLILGAGVAGAIRKKGGPEIQQECHSIGHCPVGEAVITSAGNLKTRFVIHAVGPRNGEGNEAQKLRNATRNSLLRAEEAGLTSITFPAISTGIFGFPVEDCACIMLSTVFQYLEGNTSIQKVCFALFDPETLQVFEKQLSSLKA